MKSKRESQKQYSTIEFGCGSVNTGQYKLFKYYFGSPILEPKGDVTYGSNKNNSRTNVIHRPVDEQRHRSLRSRFRRSDSFSLLLNALLADPANGSYGNGW